MPAGQGELASDAICTAIMDVPGEVDSLEKLTQWMKEHRTMLKNLVATYRATHGKEASSIDMKQFKTLCQKLIHWRQVTMYAGRPCRPVPTFGATYLFRRHELREDEIGNS